MRILVIANPLVAIHPEKKRVLDAVMKRLTADGITLDTAYILDRGNGFTYASRAALEGYDAVFAAGGDGTINEIAWGLAGRPTPLGILPLGTGNGFARGLGLPLDTDGIIGVLTRRKVTIIDTGSVGDRFFLATAGIGYDAEIAYEFNRTRPTKISKMQYFTVGIKIYFLKRSEPVKLIIDGTEMKRRIFALTVCNTPQYGSGAVVAPKASPTSGTLIAVIIPKLNIVQGLFSLPKLFDGTIESVKGLEFIPFTSMTVVRERENLYHFDGETENGPAKLEISVNPSSLKVFMP